MRVHKLTLTKADVDNIYVVLPEAPKNPGDVILLVKGAPVTFNGDDFTIVSEQGESRLKWVQAEMPLQEGEKLTILY